TQVRQSRKSGPPHLLDVDSIRGRFRHREQLAPVRGVDFQQGPAAVPDFLPPLLQILEAGSGVVAVGLANRLAWAVVALKNRNIEDDVPLHELVDGKP